MDHDELVNNAIKRIRSEFTRWGVYAYREGDNWEQAARDVAMFIEEVERLRADLDTARSLIEMLDEELALPIGHPLTQAVNSWMAKHPSAAQ